MSTLPQCAALHGRDGVPDDGLFPSVIHTRLYAHTYTRAHTPHEHIPSLRRPSPIGLCARVPHSGTGGGPYVPTVRVCVCVYALCVCVSGCIMCVYHITSLTRSCRSLSLSLRSNWLFGTHTICVEYTRIHRDRRDWSGYVPWLC